jgi:hypothetical protein
MSAWEPSLARKPHAPAAASAPLEPHFACELHSEALSEEIKLLGDLVLAASRVTRHLSEDEVGQILTAHRPTMSHCAAVGAPELQLTSGGVD